MSSTVSKQGRITTRQLTMTALFVALIAVGAFIRVPLPNCPFTLQILFTTLAGIVLGSRLGAASVGIYIVLGLIGVPIFTSGGGPGYILQPTFGYLIGFMVGAYAVGRIAESMETLSFKRLLAGSILNLLQMPQFNHQVELTTGVLEEECSQMMKTFFKELREKRKKNKQ